MNLCDHERKPWFQVYADVWKSQDGNESRVYLPVPNYGLDKFAYFNFC